MGLLRKLKQLTCGRPHIDQRPRPRPRPRAPSPSSQRVYGPLPDSFFQAVNAAREGSGYDPLPVFHRGSAKALDQSRNNSSEQLHRLPPGTPIKYRRRPVSPELLRPRSASVSSMFQHPHSVPGSPELMHRFEFEPMVEQVPMQQHPQMMMMAHSMPFFPSFQQPFHPMIHPPVQMPGQGWFMRSPAPVPPFAHFY